MQQYQRFYINNIVYHKGTGYSMTVVETKKVETTSSNNSVVTCEYFYNCTYTTPTGVLQCNWFSDVELQ